MEAKPKGTVMEAISSSGERIPGVCDTGVGCGGNGGSVGVVGSGDGGGGSGRARRSAEAAAVDVWGSAGRFLYTHNPFYLISAVLVLWGLDAGFNSSYLWINTLVPLAVLLLYTAVLAITAVVVVRCGRVWEDARSILVCMGILFMALSASLDEIVLRESGVGVVATLAVFLAVLAVVCGVLWGLRIHVRMALAVPCFGLLACLFLYPLLPAGLVLRGWQTPANWSVVLFPALCSLVLLLSVPAVRHGRGYGADNGSPWVMFPWVLLGVLVVAVAVRAYLLTLAFYPGPGVGGFDKLESGFGVYFLVPLYLAVMWLLLEAGLAGERPWLQRVAVAGVVLGTFLALPWGTGNESYREMRAMVVSGIGSPAVVAAYCAVVLCFLAWVRGVPSALAALMISLLCATVIGPEAEGVASLVAPRLLPLLMLVGACAWLAWWKGASAWCLAACWGGVGCLCVAFRGTWFVAARGAIPFHLGVACMLAVGAAYGDAFARLLRRLGALGLCLLAAVATFSLLPSVPHVPEWAVWLYLTGVFGVQLLCFLWLREIVSLWGALVVGCLTGLHGLGSIHRLLRAFELRGTDRLVWGCVFFLVAVAISLEKAGVPQRLFANLAHAATGNGRGRVEGGGQREEGSGQ